MAAMLSVRTVYRPIVEPLKHIHAMPAFIIPFSFRPVQSPTKLLTAFYSTLNTPNSQPPSFESVPVASFLLNECGFSLHEANIICRRKPYLLAQKSYDNSLQTLHFLRDKGFNEISVRKIFSRYPHLLRSSFEGIVMPKVEFLERIGLTGQKLLQVLNRGPSLLSSNVSRTLEPNVSFLQSVFDPHLAAVVSNPESDKIAGTKLDFHKIAGKVISSHSLTTSVILRSPRVLSLSKKVLAGLVKDVEGMGIEKGSKAFARSFICFSKINKDAVKLKLGNLRELGFTEEEVRILVKKQPYLLGSSKDKVRQNLKFLDDEWKLPRNAIMGHPAALGYSIEKRLKPRLNALRGFMMMNKSSEKAMSYSPIYYISMSNRDFHRKVVSRLPGYQERDENRL